MPFIEAPQWCIDALKKEPSWKRKGFLLNCNNLDIPFSSNPTFSPVFIAMLEFFCLGFIVFFRWSKTKWGVARSYDWKHNLIFGITISIISIDNICAIAIFRRPFVAILLRPIVFGTFLHLVRTNSRQFLHDIKDSAAFIVAIFLFIFTYSLIGVYLFRYSYEGYTHYPTFDLAVYKNIILMTTANFPDIMLPAYERNYWFMLYFVSYLILGLFFLMSFLLANVFNKFKTRLVQKATSIHCKTENLLVELFNRYDIGDKGYLSYSEAKEFF